MKKVIIPLIIAKIINSCFFIFRGDGISISRDINHNSTYQEGLATIVLFKKSQTLLALSGMKRSVVFQ